MTNNYIQRDELLLPSNPCEVFSTEKIASQILDSFKSLPKEYQMFALTLSAFATTGIILYGIHNGYTLKYKQFSFSKDIANGE